LKYGSFLAALEQSLKKLVSDKERCLNNSLCYCVSISFEDFSRLTASFMEKPDSRFMVSYAGERMLGRPCIGLTQSLLCRWISLRHSNQDDSPHTRNIIRKITAFLLTFTRTSLRSSHFLTWNMAQSGQASSFRCFYCKRIMASAGRFARL